MKSSVSKPNAAGEYRSAIAGVMSGPEGDLRQEYLALIQQEIESEGITFFLDVVPEWDNPYDADALRLMVNLPDYGRVQLGYVRNASCYCPFCRQSFERFPAGGKCKRCGESGVVRDGLATRISAEMRKDPTLRFFGIITEITGGSGEKPSRGANLKLRKRIASPQEK